MIKMKKFFAQFKSLDLWTGIEAAFGAVLTLFSIFGLFIKGWYDQLPVYKAIVVIIIVTLQSDVFKKFVESHRSKKVSVAAEGGQK